MNREGAGIVLLAVLILLVVVSSQFCAPRATTAEGAPAIEGYDVGPDRCYVATGWNWMGFSCVPRAAGRAS